MQFDAQPNEQEMAEKGQIAAGKAAENTEAIPSDTPPNPGVTGAPSPPSEPIHDPPQTEGQLQATDELLRVKDLELANLLKQLTDATAASSEQEVLHANIRKQAEASSAELLQLQSSLSIQQQHTAMLTEQLQLAEQRAVGLKEIDGLKAQLAAASVFEQKLAETQGTLAEKESLIGQLHRDVDAAQTEQQTSLQHSRDIFARQKGRIQDLEEDLTAKEKELAKSFKALEAADVKQEKLAEQQADLKTNLSEGRTRIKELESAVSQRDRMLAAAEKEAAKIAKKQENATETLQARIAKLQSELDNAKEQRAELQAEVSKQKSLRAASDKQVQQLEKTQAKAITDHERRETAHAKKLDTLSARLESRNEQITGLKELVAELKKRPAAKVAKAPARVAKASAKTKKPAAAAKKQATKSAAPTRSKSKSGAKAAKPSKKKSSTTTARKATLKKQTTAAKPKAPALSSYKATLARFKEADVKADRELGVVFSKRPKQRDDLKKINGVGAADEKKLNKDGIFLFQQIAHWNKYNISAFDDKVGSQGRINQEKWVRQAKELAKGNPRSAKKTTPKKKK